MELLASPLGFLIGISLGAVGAGGSILAVPILVFVLGLEAKEATTASLVIVGSVSLGGMLAHWKAGRVRWTRGITFGLTGVVGAVGGSFLNRAADQDTLLLLFAGLMVVAAWMMLRRRARVPSGSSLAAGGERSTGASGRLKPSPAGATGTGGGGPAMGRAGPESVAPAKVALAGSVVGSVTGFFGVGGGFVVVPALTLVLGMPMHQAIGTSLLVIVINSAVALGARMGMADTPWGVIGPFAIAGLVGVAVGTMLAGRLPAQVLGRLFAGVILVIAAYTAGSTLAGM